MRKLTYISTGFLQPLILALLLLLTTPQTYATVDICAVNPITKQCIWGDEMNFSYIGYGWQWHGEKCQEMKDYCDKNKYTMTDYAYLLELLVAGLVLLIMLFAYFLKRYFARSR